MAHAREKPAPRTRPPRPIRRPIAEWIEGAYEAYPDRFYFAVSALPALPFLIMVAIPFARAYGESLVAGGLTLAAALGALRWRNRAADRREAERARTHACAQCGYDLRATPYVCPECGAFATPPPGWRQPPEFAQTPPPTIREK